MSNPQMNMMDKTSSPGTLCINETRISDVRQRSSGTATSLKKHAINAKTKLQGCVKLPESRQSETSLGKGVNDERIKILHVEGFQASKQIPRTHN
jgi:hypothetical protein